MAASMRAVSPTVRAIGPVTESESQARSAGTWGTRPGVVRPPSVRL